MNAEYTDIPPELMGKADPDQQWIERKLDCIDPWRNEQGHEGATDRALRKLVLELRTKLTTPQPETGGPAFPSVYGTMDNGDGFTQNQGETGITVRDYFAAHASEQDVQHYCVQIRAKSEIGILPDNWPVIARYMHADAMLKARAA